MYVDARVGGGWKSILVKAGCFILFGSGFWEVLNDWVLRYISVIVVS